MGLLIAEWNRTDLSQFVQASIDGGSDVSAGGATRILSVVPIAERGNVLRYSGGAAGASTTQIFMFSIASGMLMPSTDERRDIDVEIEMLTSAGGGGYLGVFFMGDLDTPLHGIAHAYSGPGSEWQYILNNGGFSQSGGTGNNSNRVSLYTIRGRKPAGAPPEVSCYCDGWNANGTSTYEPRRTGSTATARGTVAEFGSGVLSMGATWNDISADRIGLFALSSGGNPAPTFDLLSFRVIDPWA